jgi:hypothetical protein
VTDVKRRENKDRGGHPARLSLVVDNDVAEAAAEEIRVENWRAVNHIIPACNQGE